MSTPVTPPTPNAPEEVLPGVCPYCNADPVEFSIITAVQALPGGALALASIFCSNPECRKLFNVQIVGGEPNRIQPVGGGAGIRRPS